MKLAAFTGTNHTIAHPALRGEIKDDRPCMRFRIDRTKRSWAQTQVRHKPLQPRHSAAIGAIPDESDLETRMSSRQSDPALSGMCGQAETLDLLHPLTGPVYIGTAPAGDLSDIEILRNEPRTATAKPPGAGFGFYVTCSPSPFKANWDIAVVGDSADRPGCASTCAPFIGIIGLSPGTSDRRHNRPRTGAARTAAA